MKLSSSDLKVVRCVPVLPVCLSSLAVIRCGLYLVIDGGLGVTCLGLLLGCLGNIWPVSSL